MIVKFSTSQYSSLNKRYWVANIFSEEMKHLAFAKCTHNGHQNGNGVKEEGGIA
jgi:hypothetical protein